MRLLESRSLNLARELGHKFRAAARSAPEPPVFKGVAGRSLDAEIEEAVAIAREAAGGGVVVLGATVARQCLEAGLLDEIIVHVAPVRLGDR